MSDPRVDKLAEVLVRYSVGVEPGDRVLIQGGAIAEPMLLAILAEVLKAGGFPLTIVHLADAGETMFRYASDDQLRHVPEPMKLVFETYDAAISLMSAVNTKALSNVAPEKLVVTSQAQRPLFQQMMQRTAAGRFDWVGALYPTAAYAQDAEMGLAEYEDFVYTACLPQFDDPIGYWRGVEKRQQQIVDWLRGKDEIRVEANDVDLRMKITNRSFVNCCGKRNMPDGEVFTGPV